MGQKKPVFWHNLRSDNFRSDKINPDESAPENHSEIGHDTKHEGKYIAEK